MKNEKKNLGFHVLRAIVIVISRDTYPRFSILDVCIVVAQKKKTNRGNLRTCQPQPLPHPSVRPSKLPEDDDDDRSLCTYTPSKHCVHTGRLRAAAVRHPAHRVVNSIEKRKKRSTHTHTHHTMNCRPNKNNKKKGPAR